MQNGKATLEGSLTVFHKINIIHSENHTPKNLPNRFEDVPTQKLAFTCS